MDFPSGPYPGQYPDWQGPTLYFPTPQDVTPENPPQSNVDKEFREAVKEAIAQMYSKKRQLKGKRRQNTKLNYLGYPGADEHLRFGADGKVWIPYQNYIPIPLLQLMDKLIEVLTLEEEEISQHEPLQHFLQVTGLLHYLLNATLSSTTSSYEKLFNPALQDSKDVLIEKFKKADPALRLKKSNEFVHQFVKTVRLANFTPLSQHEIDFADTPEEFLFGTPVKIDWDKLDSQVLSDYLNSVEVDEGLELPAPPSFARQCLVFWRGADLQKRTGMFYLQKLDCVLQSFTNSIKAKLGLPVPTPQIQEVEEDEDKPEESATTIHDAHYLQRKTLNKNFALSSFFRPVTIHEPIYKEVVILFKRKPESAEEESNGIFIQRFYDVPMKNLKTIFPVNKAAFNWADYVFAITVLFWVATLLFKAFTTLSRSTNIDEAVLSFGVLLFPLFLRYLNRKIAANRSSRLCSNMLSSSIQNNSLNCNTSVLTYVRQCAVEQEFKEAALAYYVIWKWDVGIKREELDAACEYLLQKSFGVELDFQVDDALMHLLEYNVICQEGELYFPLRRRYGNNNIAIKHLEDALLENARDQFVSRTDL